MIVLRKMAPAFSLDLERRTKINQLFYQVKNPLKRQNTKFYLQKLVLASIKKGWVFLGISELT